MTRTCAQPPVDSLSDSVLVCGEALYDLFLDERAEDQRAVDERSLNRRYTEEDRSVPPGAAARDSEATLQARLGGSPCNVAIGLARLGRRAALFTGLATDTLGVRLRRALRTEGVDATACADKPGAATTLSLVATDAAGVPRYTFYGQAGAERALGEDDLPQLAPDCAVVHFGSYSLVVEPTASTLLALAERERARRLISLDPNIRPGVEPDLALWRRRIGEWSALAALIKVSEEDLQLLYPERPPLAAAEAWLRGGAQLVVVTRGARGAVGLSRGSRVEVEAPPVRVVDTVGAGDTFQAVLLHGLLIEPALHEWLRDAPGPVPEAAAAALRNVLGRAACAAALTCTRIGAQLPRASELERFCMTGI